MKKLLSTVLALVFILSFAMIPAEAKILHQCHACYGTGKYKCDASDCVNGMIPCGKCNGTGTEKEQCAECGGTGICRMCQGSKTITDQNGETRECGHCHGSGKCQGGPGKGPCTNGYYINTCPDCGGKGSKVHDSEWCKYAQSHNGNCPVCKGTGYEGDGVEGTPNNGSSNRPQPGDGIYNLDGSYYVYGGGSSGGNNGGSSSSDTTAAPAVTTTQANSDTPAPVLNPDIGRTTVNYAPVTLPDNRQDAMYLGTPEITSDDYAGTTATGMVDYSRMSPDQQAVYDSIPDEQLAQILGNVQGIISTVKYDTADESKAIVEEFLKVNNLEILNDANILPISFDGHIEIGFPVLVSVEVDQDRFDGSKPLHVFHIKEDGSIEQIPDENVTWIANEDGKIRRVEYFTDSFSDFLLSDAEDLVVPENLDTDTSDEPVITPGATEKSHSALKIVAIVAVVLIAIGALVFFILKNRKTPDPIDEIKDPIDEIPEPETEEKKDE